MKKLAALAGVLALVVGIASSQETMMKGTQAGDKSLNFTFGGIGTFGVGAAGPMGGISVSHFLTNDAAVRAGLQVGLYSTSTPTNAPTGGTDGSSSTTTIGLAADYLMYMTAANSRVHPYLGGGVFFTTKSKTVEPTDKAGFDKQEGGQPTTFGLAGIMGAEFFVYPELSFSAEYMLNIISLTSTSDLKTTVGSTTTTAKGGSATSILGFGAGGVTVHIYL